MLQWGWCVQRLAEPCLPAGAQSPPGCFLPPLIGNETSLLQLPPTPVLACCVAMRWGLRDMNPPNLPASVSWGRPCKERNHQGLRVLQPPVTGGLCHQRLLLKLFKGTRIL